MYQKGLAPLTKPTLHPLARDEETLSAFGNNGISGVHKFAIFNEWMKTRR
jgi:hypothetical protein